jgi:predicted negative regulator of RcsB-dependent stress response
VGSFWTEGKRMSMKNGRLKDHIRNVLSVLFWGILLTIGLYSGWILSKQIRNESQESLQESLNEIVQQLKKEEKTRVEQLAEIADYMSNVAAVVASYHGEENSSPLLFIRWKTSKPAWV